MTKPQNTRQSNLEALRILSMLLVLIFHCTSVAVGPITYEWAREAPVSAFYFADVEAMTLVCVNCFVLISGYFGIKARWSGLCKLLFIIYFWRLAICLTCGQASGIMPTVRELIFCFNPFTGEWFVGAYMGLYAMSIILNGFADNVPRDVFKRGLLVYLCLQILLGWVLSPVPNSVTDFGNGYTTLSLVGIYLIGRYIGKYHSAVSWSIGRLLLTFLAICAANALIYFLLTFVMRDPLLADIRHTWFVSYDSAFTLAASVCLLLTFTKLRFTNRVVNWMAASAFSVYLIHCNAHVLGYYLEVARMIFDECWPWLWLPAVICFAAAVYIVCTLLDQIRVGAWALLMRAIGRKGK